MPPTFHFGYFLGYSNHSSIVLCFKPSTNKLVQTKQIIVDEFGLELQKTEQALTPAEYVLRDYPQLEGDPSKDAPPIQISSSNLDWTENPVTLDKFAMYVVTILPNSEQIIGVTIDTKQIQSSLYLS